MNVRRIDPYAERIRRNRLHPRHQEFARPAWRSGLWFVDPLLPGFMR